MYLGCGIGWLEAVRYHNNIITAGPDNRLLDYAARTDKHWADFPANIHFTALV